MKMDFTSVTGASQWLTRSLQALQATLRTRVLIVLRWTTSTAMYGQSLTRCTMSAARHFTSFTSLSFWIGLRSQHSLTQECYHSCHLASISMSHQSCRIAVHIGTLHLRPSHLRLERTILKILYQDDVENDDDLA